MPGGRCCWKGGWIGSRWASARRTWNSRKARRRRRARSPWPSGCRRCCWAFRATRPMPITKRRTGRFTGEIVEMRPDIEQVTALAHEREAQWRRVAGADFLSREEKRRMLGLPPLAQGEVAEADMTDEEEA